MKNQRKKWVPGGNSKIDAKKRIALLQKNLKSQKLKEINKGLLSSKRSSIVEFQESMHLAKGEKQSTKKNASKRTKSENPHFDSIMRNQSIFSKEQVSDEDGTVVIKTEMMNNNPSVLSKLDKLKAMKHSDGHKLAHP